MIRSTGKPRVTAFLHRPRGDVTSVEFSSDGKTLAAGCVGGPNGGGVLVWDVILQAQTGLSGPEGPVTSIAFSPDGKTLAAGRHRGPRDEPRLQHRW